MRECRPRGIMFHHFIENEQENSIGAISPQYFESIILSFSRGSILSAEEWFERAVTNSLSECQVCITLDDALKSQIDLALPVLEKYDLTAFWFIYSSVFQEKGNTFEVYRRFYDTSFVSFDHFFEAFLGYIRLSLKPNDIAAARRAFSESDYLKEFDFYSDNEREYRFFRDRLLGRERYRQLMQQMLVDRELTFQELSIGLWMDNDDLLRLSQDGHIIGLHSYSHPTEFVSMNYEAQLQEYRMNAKHILDVTGSKPEVVAHPVNSYGAETLEILSAMGIKVGFRSNMVKPNYGPLEHPREDCVNVTLTR